MTSGIEKGNEGIQFKPQIWDKCESYSIMYLPLRNAVFDLKCFVLVSGLTNVSIKYRGAVLVNRENSDIDRYE